LRKAKAFLPAFPGIYLGFAAIVSNRTTKRELLEPSVRTRRTTLTPFSFHAGRSYLMRLNGVSRLPAIKARYVIIEQGGSCLVSPWTRAGERGWREVGKRVHGQDMEQRYNCLGEENEMEWPF
jgi:hypothetical protein